jgi:hypothetical protein
MGLLAAAGGTLYQIGGVPLAEKHLDRSCLSTHEQMHLRIFRHQCPDGDQATGEPQSATSSSLRGSGYGLNGDADNPFRSDRRGQPVRARCP